MVFIKPYILGELKQSFTSHFRTVCRLRVRAPRARPAGRPDGLAPHCRS